MKYSIPFFRVILQAGDEIWSPGISHLGLVDCIPDQFLIEVFILLK
jgi:hypothetical protein